MASRHAEVSMCEEVGEYTVCGRVYNVRKYLTDAGMDANTAKNYKKDHYEYNIDLFQGDNYIDNWDSLIATYDGMQRLTKKEANDSLKDAIKDISQSKDFRAYFHIDRMKPIGMR